MDANASESECEPEPMRPNALAQRLAQVMVLALGIVIGAILAIFIAGILGWLNIEC